MPDRTLVTPLLVGRLEILTSKEAIEPQLEMATLIGFGRGTVATPEDPDLRAEFRAVQLVTFAVISRCCSPGVQIALKSCREYHNAGHWAWHFIESNYLVTDDLFIALLEGQLTRLRMGDQETATDYCNRAQRTLATIRMAGAQYSTASYVMHVMQGLSSSYNLLKRLSMAPSIRATLNEDTLTSYILQDEAMQEAEQSQELLVQANYVALSNQGGRPGQRGSLVAVVAVAGSRPRTPTRRSRSRKAVVEEEVDVGSAGCMATLTTYSSSALIEVTPTRTMPRQAAGGLAAVVTVEVETSRARRSSQPSRRQRRTPTLLLAAKGETTKRRCARWSAWWSRPTVSLAPEAGEDLQAVAAAVQANPVVVLLDNGCLHHPIGTNEVFVDLQPSGDVKHMHGLNGALQDIQSHGSVALQGEAVKQVLIPVVLYVPGMRPNLLSAGQLKENGVKLQEDGDGMLLLSVARVMLGWATYTGRVLCTDLRPCSTKQTTTITEVVAPQAIVSTTKATPDRLHARLEHISMDTIRSSTKHEVAIGLDLKSASGADLSCVSCVGGKLARHTIPDQGSNADDVLAVVHIDLCGPFRAAAKDGSLYFLLLKDRKTRYVWVRPVGKKSDALQEFVEWLAVAERQTKKSVLMLHSDQGGEFLGKRLTDFVNGKGIRGGKLKPNARWGLHLGVSEESKDWELLDIADNLVVTTSDVVFYESTSLEVWKSEHGLASGRTPVHPSTDTSTATLPLLAEVGELADEDAEIVRPPSPPTATLAPPLVADVSELTPVSASNDEGRSGTSPSPPAKSIAGGRRDEQQDNVRVNSTLIGEEQAVEVKPTTDQSATRQLAEEPTTGEKSAGTLTVVQQDAEGSKVVDEGGDAEESTDGDVVEVQNGPRQSGRIRRPPDFFVPAAFTTVYDVGDDDLPYDDAKEDEDFPELDPDIHADLEHPRHEECFLQSKLDRVLYMYQPDYFDDGTGRVCKLLKSLYGLKQSPLLWYQALNDVLVLVYVDDLLAANSNFEKLNELLEAAFKLCKNSLVQKYLRLEIVRDGTAGQMWLHQQGYADKPHRRFIDEEQTGRTPKTPVLVDAHAELTFDDEVAQERQEEYQQKVGSLQFAVTTTRPNIAFACSKLGSGLTVRSDQHWREVDRCLTYLANTRDTALEFGGGPESLELVSYVDADDAGDKQKRMSTGGYVFVHGLAAVSWSSQHIKCVTLLSTEWEYVADTEAGKEGRYLRFLLAKLRQLDDGKPTVLRVDNKSAITVAEGMGLTGNLKHMEWWQAWLQHMVKRGKFSVK
ncbi:unnamed protein product [Closterium sp. NIES-65]|nr:unnamed protein product [Closterium sp. NIES-65]